MFSGNRLKKSRHSTDGTRFDTSAPPVGNNFARKQSAPQTLTPGTARLPVIRLLLTGIIAMLFGTLPSPNLSENLSAAETQVIFKDGRIVTGSIAPLKSVFEVPVKEKESELSNIQSEKIIVIDDQLRRIYVPKNQIQDMQPDEIGASLEIFRIKQRVDTNPKDAIAVLGLYRTRTPFDEFGRRTLKVQGIPFIQGITEIAPTYIRVQGISLMSDMRISPYSIDRTVLSRLIKKQIDPQNLNDRLRIYQFYVQAELYEQAAEELQEIMDEFQGEEANDAQLDVALRLIRQLAAQRLLDELELRRNSGQHKKVRFLLKSFESTGVSVEKIQAIRRMIQQCDDAENQCQQIISQLESFAENLSDEKLKESVAPVLKEIKRELNSNTLERFAEFQLTAQDASQTDEAKLAIGLTSWLAGNIGVDNRLEIAASMYRVRQLARKYLLEKIPAQREKLWHSIREEEASNPERIARILFMMKPPKSTPDPSAETPGYYELEVPSYDGVPISYCVQLPPEYDPNRKYPAIVTLHGERTSPQLQIDWWCGSWIDTTNEKGKKVRERYGQATRYGYIIIAPKWSDKGISYDYSAASHAAVLYTLRDASRRFSIDSDRVFLSGHSSGGTAAWDIGLAHPDLWAGIIPICGVANGITALLKRNAEFVPVYAIGGELDGGKLALSKDVLDWGMDLSKPFDLTYTQFKGRGNESFSDETVRIFQWMQLRYRHFSSTDRRTVYTVRLWDNFFWCTELFDFSPKSMIDPVFHTRTAKDFHSAKTEFVHLANNSIQINSGADWAIIFLSPEFIDFGQKIKIQFNGKKISPQNGIILPSSRVILEDARSRADRQHPFWASVNTNFPGKMNEWDSDTPE